MLDVLPVVAQEEKRTGQNPATVRRSKQIDLIFLVFIAMLATAMGGRGALSLPELGMWKSRMNWQ
jgi:hypothetical protein